MNKKLKNLLFEITSEIPQKAESTFEKTGKIPNFDRGYSQAIGKYLKDTLQNKLDSDWKLSQSIILSRGISIDTKYIKNSKGVIYAILSHAVFTIGPDLKPIPYLSYVVVTSDTQNLKEIKGYTKLKDINQLISTLKNLKKKYSNE